MLYIAISLSRAILQASGLARLFTDSIRCLHNFFKWRCLMTISITDKWHISSLSHRHAQSLSEADSLVYGCQDMNSCDRTASAIDFDQQCSLPQTRKKLCDHSGDFHKNFHNFYYFLYERKKFYLLKFTMTYQSHRYLTLLTSYIAKQEAQLPQRKSASAVHVYT